MSTSKQQASIKKMPIQAAYRFILEPDEAALKVGIQRAKMLRAAMSMGPEGLPAPEFTPGRDHFPCDFCEWKSICTVNGSMGLTFPAIPEWMSVKPAAEVA